MEDVEVVVRCIPTSVVFECPYCEEENEYDYSELDSGRREIAGRL